MLTGAALVVGLAGQRHEFATALADVALTVLALAALLQIVALLARTEAWHLSIEAAGGSVARRILYRASSMQVLGSVLNGQLGVAARITALRRSSPTVSPQVPTLIAAEFPILAVAATGSGSAAAGSAPVGGRAAGRADPAPTNAVDLERAADATTST